MNRVLIAIGGLMVGLLALLFVAPAVVDWNRYRGIFEEEATRFLGREVRVGGKVNLRLLPVPFVRFEQVRVADTAANVGKPLFQAEDFTIWLSVGGLLAGNIEASAIELTRPIVTLVLDAEGGGSWSSLKPSEWSSSFGGANVAFDAVRITDGRIQILSPSGAERTAFQHINGEFSAASLLGPYKVSAAFALAGAPRELRLSTAAPAEDGTVRIRGTVRNPVSRVSYTVDGLLKDALGRTSLTGDLTAHLPLPSMLDAARQGAAEKPADGKGEFDVRAKLTANTSGLALDDLALSFEQAGRPQLATGKAQVSWAERTDVSVTLRSHWLDLDRIAGNGKQAVSPLHLAQTLATGVGAVLSTEGHTVASLVIDQATLGGDVVSNLTATLDQTEGKLGIRELRAGLPGGARLSAGGSFDMNAAVPRFDGRVSLRGASLKRFMGWAAPAHNKEFAAIHDSGFSLIGDLSMSATGVAGRNLALQIGRNQLAGEASWKDGKPREIVVDLEGSEIDLTPILDPDVPPARGLRKLIASATGAPPTDAKSTTAPQGGNVPVNARIRLRVDRMVAGRSVFRDAATTLELTNGNLSIGEIRLLAEEGYELRLNGDIANLSRPEAKGTLTAYVSTATRGGLEAASRLLELPGDLTATLLDGKNAASLLPLHMAARLSVGSRGDGTEDWAVDGALGESRLAGTIRLGKATASWRDRATDVALTLNGTAVAHFIAGLSGADRVAASPGGQDGKRVDDDTQLLFRGVGTPSGGLVALGLVEAPGVRNEYSGRILVEEQGAVGLAGDLEIAFADAAKGMARVGLSGHPALAGPMSGVVSVERKAARLALSTEALSLAGSKASGKVTVEPAGEGGSRRITGNIALDRASIPGLLAFLSDKDGAAAGTALPAAKPLPSPWSEQPLALASLDRLAGSTLQVTARTLDLTPAVSLDDARLEVALRSGGIDVHLKTARALDGRATGLLTLDKAPAGAKMTAEGKLVGGRLEKLARMASTAPATGRFAFTFKGSGTALTPRGLIVALAGSGDIGLDRAVLKRWNPASVGLAAESLIGMQGEIPPGSLLQQIELGLAKGGGLQLGSPRLEVTLADGALRTAPLVAQTSKGQLTGRLIVDIDTQQLDATWRIEPKAAPPKLRPLPPPVPPSLVLPELPHKPDLPAISITYAGPLASAGDLEPQYDIAALEREVTVRKVEREVTELERLRKLDEERARLEAERQEQQRLDESRAAAEGRLPGAVQPANPSDLTAPATPQLMIPGSDGRLVPAPSPVPGQPGYPPLAPTQQQGAVVPGQPGAPQAITPGAVPPTTVEITPVPQPARRAKPPPSKRPYDAFRTPGGG